MDKHIITQNEKGEFIVSIQRELGMVPILRTRRKEEAELMIHYLEETNIKRS